MRSRYADPVDVQHREGDPTAFLWRGRVFVVQGVLAHWVETGPWWQSASVRALLASGERSAGRPRVTGSQAGGRQTGGVAPDAAARARLGGGQRAAVAGDEPPLDPGEREFWQVRAAPGRHAVPGVYELCADWTSAPAGAWSVTRTADG